MATDSWEQSNQRICGILGLGFVLSPDPAQPWRDIVSPLSVSQHRIFAHCLADIRHERLMAIEGCFYPLLTATSSDCMVFNIALGRMKQPPSGMLRYCNHFLFVRCIHLVQNVYGQRHCTHSSNFQHVDHYSFHEMKTIVNLHATRSLAIFIHKWVQRCTCNWMQLHSVTAWVWPLIPKIYLFFYYVFSIEKWFFTYCFINGVLYFRVKWYIEWIFWFEA